MFLYISAITISVVLITVSVLAISVTVKYSKRPLDKIYQLLQQQADFCALDGMPERFISMLIESEDKEFYKHHGICIDAIREAIQINIEVRKMITSRSTITQQLVKNLYFDFNKTLWRKLQEMLLAVKAERVLSKNEILEMYINIIYFGCGQYGIASASAYYFSKLPKDLTVNQMFMLTRILNAPTTNNPVTHPESYYKSRDRRCDLWEQEGLLTVEEAALIRSYDIHKPDPELRDCTDEAEHFITVPMKNERYGYDSGFGK